MITYLQGDATQPLDTGDKIRVIAHSCNDDGVWGGGVGFALSRRWAAPKEAYRLWYREQRGFELGAIQLRHVEPGISVCNMIAQHGGGAKGGVSPIHHEALAMCLRSLGDLLHDHSASVHMPRIGCGLAGGTWDKVEPLIQEHLCDQGSNVYVYDLEKKDAQL